MAQNKSVRLQKEIDTLKAQKPATTLSPAAPPFHVGGSPISSPRIPAATGSAPSSPAVSISPVSPVQTKSPILTSKNNLLKKAIASSVNTAELSSTPVPPSVDTPILTPITTPVVTPVPQEDEEPVITEEPSNDEAIPPTSDVTSTAETADEAAASMQVDAELVEEESELDKQSNKDEVPVEVEIHIQNENPEILSPPADNEADAIEEMARDDEEKNAESLDHFSDVEEEVVAPDATNNSTSVETIAVETTTSEPNPADPVEADIVEADIVEADAVEADATEDNTAEADAAQDDLSEGNTAEANATATEDENKSNKISNEPVVVIGTKRERDDEEEDLSGLESPNKKH
ncbi:hypothetical protein BD408DRAFT_420324 [Parasitella parasitica]|nr:hypothetical protein BD408DRAFT_420324 [Parasitella parasitica]